MALRPNVTAGLPRAIVARLMIVCIVFAFGPHRFAEVLKHLAWL